MSVTLALAVEAAMGEYVAGGAATGGSRGEADAIEAE